MNRPRTAATLALLALASVGVAVGAAAARPEAPAPAAPALHDAFKVDAVHSSIVFSIRHNHLNDVHGRFNTFSGEFHIDPADAAGSSMNITVDVGSVDTANDGRDKHLIGPDFFSTKEFPKATFKSTTFTKTGDNTFDVAGDFELHGVKKPVTAKVEYRGQGKGGRNGELTVSGFVATLTIKRSDFGITKYLENLGDEVPLTISLQGAQ